MLSSDKNFTPLATWVECLPMVQETRVQSQVESYQRLKKKKKKKKNGT